MKASAEPGVISAGQGLRVGILGDLYTFKITGEHTGGAFALTEVTVFPGNGTPPHVHHREEETFCVLEGQITFHVAGRVLRAGVGDLVFAPRDVPHHFQNLESRPARMLCINSPAGLERFFAEIGEPLPSGSDQPAPATPQAIERIMEIAPRYGIDILPPA